MLSKTEQEFLNNPASFNSNYQRSLHCCLKVKAEKMREELSLLKSSGVVENCSGVAEFCSGDQSPKQVISMNQGQDWSLRRDLDPRPLPYQGRQIIDAMSFRAFNWFDFKKYVQNKYRKTTAKRVMCYAKRYFHVLESGNVGQLNAVPSTIRSNAIKSLIIISKYVGCYEQLKTALKSYGIKCAQPDALAAFVRIYSNTNNNLDEWFAKVKPELTPQENLLLDFLRLTGLRCSEGIESFNLIIELSAKGKLSEYLSHDTGILEHFRYKDKFLRGTKNAFISIVPEALISEITQSQPVS